MDFARWILAISFRQKNENHLVCSNAYHLETFFLPLLTQFLDDGTVVLSTLSPIPLKRLQRDHLRNHLDPSLRQATRWLKEHCQTIKRRQNHDLLNAERVRHKENEDLLVKEVTLRLITVLLAFLLRSSSNSFFLFCSLNQPSMYDLRYYNPTSTSTNMKVNSVSEKYVDSKDIIM